MTASFVLGYLLMGMVLGALGQSARMIVGIKKTFDEAAAQKTSVKELFDAAELMISLLIGATAGGLAAVTLLGASTIDNHAIGMLIASGYAGADFIEGFMRKAGGGNAALTAGGTSGAQPSVPTHVVTAEELKNHVPEKNPTT